MAAFTFIIIIINNSDDKICNRKYILKQRPIDTYWRYDNNYATFYCIMLCIQMVKIDDM